MNQTTELTLNKTLELWTRMCHEFGVGKRHHTSIADAAQKLGFSESDVSRRSRMFKQLGLLTVETEYEWQRQKIYWTIAKPKFEGEKVIREFFENGGNLTAFEGHREVKTETTTVETKPTNGTYDPEKVAVRVENKVPVEAIVGPDAPTPFETLRAIRKDEAEGLLEAAKQYAGRQTAVEQSFQQLESLGLKIDRAQALKAIAFERDEILEAVSQLLPYITRLEHQVTQMGEWKAEVIEARRAVKVATEQYNQQKDANKRLSDRMARMLAAADPTLTQPTA